MQLAIADVNKTRDIASQIEQGMQLDSGFGCSKRRPGENRQTQSDGGRVERINCVVQIDAKLEVLNPAAFAITIEKPGGVVVSTQDRLPLIAALN